MTTREQSAGLGLTASRLIARQAGGDLEWLDRIPDFTLTLPLYAAPL